VKVKRRVKEKGNLEKCVSHPAGCRVPDTTPAPEKILYNTVYAGGQKKKKLEKER
jgi:hypothetical protein